MTLQTFLLICQALGGPMVAGAAAWIARTNVTVARNKLKFDLFEKRVAVYTDVQEVIADAWFYGCLTDTQVSSFQTARQQAQFLFSDERINEYLKQMYPNIVGLSLGDTSEKTRAERSKVLAEFIYPEAKVRRLPMDEASHPDHDWLKYAAYVWNRQQAWGQLTHPYLKLAH